MYSVLSPTSWCGFLYSNSVSLYHPHHITMKEFQRWMDSKDNLMLAQISHFRDKEK